MGGSQSRPFSDLCKEEISLAVADLGERYKEYCSALLANGVDGSLLDSLDESEIQETLDDLEIINRLHRRVLIREINKAKSSKDFVSEVYDYGPSSSTSELEPYSQIAETCFHENRMTAVMAGVHLVLNNGNQLSLETKVLKNGQLHSKKLTIRRRLSICSNIVNDGRDHDYYKIEVPLVLQTKLLGNPSPMTYTGHIVRDESGKRIGIVCMVDRCPPSEIVNGERKAFLRKMARETESLLSLRKQQIEKQTKKEIQSSDFKNHMPNQMLQDNAPYPDDQTLDVVQAYTARQRPDLDSHEISKRTENEISFNSNQTEVVPKSAVPASHRSPKFQDTASEAEKEHLSADFYDLVDEVSAPRPPIPKNDMERVAAVAALSMQDIGPEDEIAHHLKNMVKMAKQVFGFPHGEITFLDHEHQYRIAGHGESDDIVNTLNTFFQPIQCNRDGSRFLCKMPRGPAVCNYVLASESTFVVQDLEADETFRWLANMSPLRSYVGTPIKDSTGRVVAVLCLFDTMPRPDFEAAHEIQIEQFASLLSQSIENWALTRSIDRLAQERQLITQARNKTGPPTGKVTLVLTDIQGSSALWESDSVSMQESQDIHDDIIRKLCAAHWGHEIETERNGFLLAFHDPVDAFGFALKAQKALFDAKWPERLLCQPEAREEAGAFKGLRVRMAIHHGRVESSDDETREKIDYKGETLNLTKALASMAQGGQILSTSETWEVAYYFMGSILGYPQVLEHGCHVVQKGTTTREGLDTKRIIQLVPSSLAYDYFAARKLAPLSVGDRRESGKLTGRQFPPIVSLKAVSASFHDAPFESNEATIAFVNLSAIEEQDVPCVINLIGRLLDGSPHFRGYQCQSEMMVFHRPIDAILFGMHLRDELGRKVGGADLAKSIRYGCIHDTFLTMGPHRSTGRADYFGKIVNRAARLSSVAAPGSVCFGIVCNTDENGLVDVEPINEPSVRVTFLGRKTLKGIQEEISVYECMPTIITAIMSGGQCGNTTGTISKQNIFRAGLSTIKEYRRISIGAHQA